jgi:hypothetical protein
MGHAAKHARPRPRQRTPAILIGLTIAIPVLLALLVASGELGRHGWASFVFRVAGTGATAADVADLNLPKQPSPQLGPKVVMIMVPAAPSAYIMVPVAALASRPEATVTITVRAGELLFIVPEIPKR